MYTHMFYYSDRTEFVVDEFTMSATKLHLSIHVLLLTKLDISNREGN